MKYILKASYKSKGLSMILMAVTLSTISQIIMARYLLLLSKILSSNQKKDLLIELGVLTIISLVVNAMRPYFYSIGHTTVWKKLSEDFYKKISESDYDFFIKYSSGELGSVEKTLGSIATMFKRITDIIVNIITLIVNIAFIINIAPVTILVILPIYIIGIIIIKIGVRQWNACDASIDEVRRKRSQLLEDSINGFYEKMSFSQEKTFHNNIMKLMNESHLRFIKRCHIDMKINVLFDLIDSITTIGILVIALSMIAKGTLTGEVGLSLVMYGWRLLQPVSSIIDNAGEISQLLSQIPKFIEIMEFKNRDTNSENVNIAEFNDEIKFCNVGFSYDSSDKVLENFNLTIKKGQHIGICGSSGGGKSTFLKLINKFHIVTKGNITIDGIDYSDIKTDSLRCKMGSVPQDPYLFNCSIYDNVKLVKPNALEHEIIDACKKASIYEFIMKLPQGFNTNVGPRGLKLSGGQKQRIALARLFLADPDIILLDEATSALDNGSEAIIQESLNSFKGKTIIAVAHRLSTIRNCDKIVVIDNHKVVEEGTHDELMNQKGIYYNMIPDDDKC